jgi:hypothetical protein
MITPIVVFFPKHSYLVESFDELLIQFQSAGLIDYWTSNEVNFAFLSLESKSNEPKAMTLQHFSSTFQIWMMFCLLAVVVFFLELLWSFLQRTCKSQRVFGDDDGEGLASIELKCH